MVFEASVAAYKGPALARGPGFVYLRPHPRLSRYIANYTVTCPGAAGMAGDYTILPTASATLTYSFDGNTVFDGLRGVNTRASVVGAHAVFFRLLLLIEFHPAGLFPLLGVPQSELLDVSHPFSDVDGALHRRVLSALLAAPDIGTLKESMDAIFLSLLDGVRESPQVAQAMHSIFESHGGVSARALSQQTHYSEKQMGRLFRQQIGTGIKEFSRIVRVNHAVRLLETAGGNLAAVAALAGYFDQPHFIHDFQALCGVTPRAFLEKRAIFYNDSYKM